MTIKGQSQTGTIINGTGTNWIFEITRDVSATLINLTFVNGTAEKGGAISNLGNLTVNGCTFTGNSATEEGGAIYNSYTDEDYIPVTLTLNSCNFKYNSVINPTGNGYGGAISNECILNVNNCIFDHNGVRAYSEAYGGAIQNHQNTCTITDSTFTNNYASVTGNEESAEAYGGAVYTKGEILKITGSTLSGNSVSATGEKAKSAGGAIFITSGGGYEIIGNHIIYNTGSGIYIAGKYVEESKSAENIIHIINFNRIYGNTPYGIERYAPPVSQKAVSTPGSPINARYNWWGSNSGPNTAGADKTNLGTAFYTPWMVMGFSPAQVTLNSGETTLLTANFFYDSNGAYHDPANGHIPDGTPVTFKTSLGQVGSPQITKYTVNAMATTLLRAWDEAGNPVWGTALISATADAQILSSSESITGGPTVNAASKTNTIGMQKTGLPLNYLVLAILMVLGGLFTPRKE